MGIVATGAIAQLVAGDLKLIENSLLAAVASRDRSRAEAFAGEFGVKRAYSDVAALIADPTVDVVYVATPARAACAGRADSPRRGQSGPV